MHLEQQHAANTWRFSSDLHGGGQHGFVGALTKAKLVKAHQLHSWESRESRRHPAPEFTHVHEMVRRTLPSESFYHGNPCLLGPFWAGLAAAGHRAESLSLPAKQKQRRCALWQSTVTFQQLSAHLSRSDMHSASISFRAQLFQHSQVLSCTF